MPIITVIYPKTEGSHFDLEYYVKSHIPFVKARLERFGLQEIRLMRGTAALNGAAPEFEIIGELSFPSMEQLQAALTAHGAEIMADIPNYTDAQPAIQINEAL
jgi:uncharacterized protein (TIGR02118 family)